MRDVARPFSFRTDTLQNFNIFFSENDNWMNMEFGGPIVVPNVKVWIKEIPSNHMKFDIQIKRPPDEKFFLNVNDIDSGAIEVQCFYIHAPIITRYITGRYGGHDVYDTEGAPDVLSHSPNEGEEYLEVIGKNEFLLHTNGIPFQIKQQTPNVNEKPDQHWRTEFVEHFKPITIVQINDYGSKTSLIGFRYIDSNESSFLDDDERKFVSTIYTNRIVRSVMFLLLSCPILKTLQTNIRGQMNHSFSNSETIAKSVLARERGLVLDHNEDIMYICNGTTVYDITDHKNVTEVETIDSTKFFFSTFLTKKDEIDSKLQTLEQEIKEKPSSSLTELSNAILSLQLVDGSPEVQQTQDHFQKMANS